MRPGQEALRVQIGSHHGRECGCCAVHEKIEICAEFGSGMSYLILGSSGDLHMYLRLVCGRL